MSPPPDLVTADRTRGVLVGLAAGDRNGGPVRLAVRLAESLVEHGGFDRADVARRYLAWWRSGAFDTGPVTARALALLDGGAPLDAVAAAVDAEMDGQTAGCNPAHRASVLAAAPLSDGQLADAAVAEARLTHAHPLAGDTSAAVVRCCRGLLRGLPWAAALTFAADGRTPEVQRSLALVGGAPLGRGGFAPETLRAAVHFVAEAATFDEALDGALAFAGPANYCPVLTGAIAGARWGATAIAARHLGHCDILARVRGAAEALAQRWPRAACP
ncbi:MAG: ADP-ribosylglycohydrolase family protein [Dehalococcoidia bacterium]